MQILIINGPNLNLLGRREKDVYGDLSFDEFFIKLMTEHQDVTLAYFQSNVEGELVDKLHEVGFDDWHIVLNAGAYTHTSVALHDAIAAIESPVMEVHISNIYAREEFRHKSLISSKCVGMISGLGLKGYELAIEFFKATNKKDI